MRVAIRIKETPGVSGGYPCIDDTRISVRSIIQMQRHVRDRAALERAFPQLSREQIQAALDYYREHPDRVDEDIARNEAAIARLRAR